MPEERPAPSPVDYRFGLFRFDGRLRRLFKDGESVALTTKAAETLAALLERAGRVVEKGELRWGVATLAGSVALVAAAALAFAPSWLSAGGGRERRSSSLDVAPDGQRFLLRREVRSSPIHVVLNWDARLPPP